MMCCGGCSLAARPFVVTPQKACCFFVVRSVATMWACYAGLWLGIICGACCESANRLYASPLVQACMFPVLALQLHPHGLCPVPHPLHRPDGRASMPVSSLKGWYCAWKGESRGYCAVMSARACVCCCALCAAVIRAERAGGLGESWMWMMSASAPHPSFQRAALGSW